MMSNEITLRYPILEIDLNKLALNSHNITALCDQDNISVTGVIKGCNAIQEVTQLLIDNGCHSIGSSRIDQIIKLRSSGIQAPMMLLRLPMLNEITDVVKHSTISLNSDKNTLNEINRVCELLDLEHQVILMYDLGDLREGIWNEKEFIELAEYVETQLPKVKLYGIGTNLGCYGSVKPTVKNMNHLAEIANIVESHIHRELEIVSGGATTSLPLVLSEQMPSKINHLRIGEGILLSKDLKEFFKCNLDYMHTDTFTLHAQIIEIQDKPSYPVGELFVDAFGNKPIFQNKGIHRRALLAVGKQDFGDHSKLVPVDESIEVIGSSSDHLIIDISKTSNQYSVGDTVGFTLFYQSMLYLSLSSDVQKIFI